MELIFEAFAFMFIFTLFVVYVIIVGALAYVFGSRLIDWLDKVWR